MRIRSNLAAASMVLAAVAPIAARADDQAAPAPHLIVSAPVADFLAKGVVVVPFRAENLTIAPRYGADALAASPRLAHLHVTVDGNPWHWVETSDQPVVIQGLPPGPHTLLLELADPVHRVIEAKTVSFAVPGNP